MKKILLTIALLFITTGACFAIMNKVKTDNRQGCCSHHGGVCGCSSGRAVCCDGTYSPTCGCN